MSKIEYAKRLCQDEKNLLPNEKGLLPNEKIKEIATGINLFNELILNRLLSQDTRIKSLIEFAQIIPEEANDKIARIRDSLPFLENEEFQTEVEMLTKIIEVPHINSYDRYLCCVCLFNNDIFEYCYRSFFRLAKDISVMINYRVDSTRFLIYSDVEEYVSPAKKLIMSFIKTPDYESVYRYNIIASFNIKTGLFATLKTIINCDKLVVSYDEKFLYQLQTLFFWDAKNGIRERILSAQHMLDMSPEIVNNKSKIVEELLKIAKNYRGEDIENTRADAADVVIRLGTKEHQEQARSIITNLGIDKLSGKQHTVYTDKQNIHNSTINKSVNEFIETVIDKTQRLQPYQIVHAEVTKAIYESDITAEERKKAFNSLNRISIDTATFTENKTTTAEIFQYVWFLVNKHEEDDKNLLKNRLLEELVDMSDTCSTGHAGRLVNVLNGYDFTLKIDIKDQIHANMYARMQKRMKDIEDDGLKNDVIIGMMDTADEEEQSVYISFIMDTIPELKKELYEEFVSNGYVSATDFELTFAEGAHKWI